MDLDLTGKNKMDYMLDFDQDSGNVTITFTDPENDNEVIGTLTIETAKYRSFMESMFTVSTEVPEQTFSSELDQVSYYRVRDNEVNLQFT